MTSVGARTVAAMLVRSWLAKLRIPARYFKIVLSAAALFLMAVSALLAIPFARSSSFGYPVLFGIVLVNLHLFVVLTAIFATSATAQESSVMSWWRAMPLSDRQLGRGLSIPVWGVAAAQAILIVPIMVVMFGRDSYANAIVLSCVALATGTVVGRALLIACRGLCSRVSTQFVSRAPAVAIFIWVLYFGLSLYAVQQMAALLSEGQVLSLWAVLGYPLLMFAVEGAVWCWLLIGVWVIVVVLAELWLRPRVGFEKHGSNKSSTLGFSYLSKGRFPVFRLELARLIRCSRVQVFIASNVITQTALIMGFRKFGFNSSGGLTVDSLSIVMFNTLFAGYYPVIARGLSDRILPYARVMGVPPGKWALAVNASAMVVSLASVTPFLIAWTSVVPDMPQVAASFSVVVFAVSIAGIIGFILMPTTNTGMLETIAVVMPFVVTVMLVYFLQNVGLGRQEQFSSVLLVAGLLLLFVPSLIERVRWSLRRVFVR